MIRFIAVISLSCAMQQASALDMLPDPTRPAVDFSATDGSADGTGAAGNDAKGVAARAPSKQGLQSVILSPGHRAAVINGETVALGGKIGGATLVEVRDSSVVLQGPQGKRVMELFPGISMNKVEPVAQKEAKPVAPKIKKAAKKKKSSKKKKASGAVSPEQLKG
jgi:MSHA biogenesis protein MshK